MTFLQPEPTGSLLLSLQRATHVTLHEIAAALVELDLTSSELNALGNLFGSAGLTVSQLGAGMGIRPTTLTSVLDRLERRGHIIRGSRAGDRRAVVVELTDSGQEAATLVTHTLSRLENALLRGVSQRDLAGFHVVLTALTERPS